MSHNPFEEQTPLSPFQIVQEAGFLWHQVKQRKTPRFSINHGSIWNNVQDYCRMKQFPKACIELEHIGLLAHQAITSPRQQVDIQRLANAKFLAKVCEHLNNLPSGL